jgi:prepilin-type N-terminal cleavage/methylation domain-containing protein
MRYGNMGKQKGMTLIELTISMVVIVVFMAAAVVAGVTLYEWSKVRQVTNQVTDVQSAVNSWGASTGVYDSLDKTDLEHYVPKGFKWTNTYGGDVDVGPGAESYEYKVTTSNIPEGAGVKLADKFPDNAVYDKGTMIVTFTFGT